MSTKSPVLLVSDGFVDYAGALARSVSRLVPTVLACPSDQADRFRSRSVGSDLEIRELSVARIRDFRSVRLSTELKSLAEELQPIAIHIQIGGNPWYTLAAKILSRAGFRVVCTVHEVRESLRDEDQWWAAASRRTVARNADEVIFLSDHVRQRFLTRYDYEKDSTTVIAHGEIASSLPVSDASLLGSLPDDYLLFFGRIRSYKGLDLVLDVAERMATEFPKIHFVVAGSGASDDERQRIERSANITPVLREIRDDEIAVLFEGASALLAPYRSSSQSGVVPVSLGFGVPVVVADVGGLAEQFSPGLDGLLIESSESALYTAVRSLAVEDEQWGRLSAGASATSKSLGWPELAQAHLEVYGRS